MLAEACLGRLAGRGAGTLRVDDAMVGFGEHPLLSSLGPGDPVGPDPMLLEASLRPPPRLCRCSLRSWAMMLGLQG